MVESVEPICRCGSDRVVAGKAIICLHCDRPHPPIVGQPCARCASLRVTCNDCRKVHLTETHRARCETGHGART